MRLCRRRDLTLQIGFEDCARGNCAESGSGRNSGFGLRAYRGQVQCNPGDRSLAPVLYEQRLNMGLTGCGHYPIGNLTGVGLPVGSRQPLGHIALAGEYNYRYDQRGN